MSLHIEQRVAGSYMCVDAYIAYSTSIITYCAADNQDGWVRETE